MPQAGYDAVGNVTRIEDYKAGALEVQSFNYDSLDRLTGVSGAYTETYAYAANGNLINKAGVDYSYSAPVSGCAAGTLGSKPHAAAQAGSNVYRYDCNGNMTERAGQVLSYDQENRLAQVIGEAVTTYRYNGDGGRVTLTTGCTTTTYVGNYFEWRGSTATSTSYYYAGGTRVAMRAGTPLTGTVSYLLGDHLGSSSVSYRVGDGQTATQRYSPWGSVRATTGGVLPTDYTFTGQKLDVSAGLMYYGARYYDAALGRFIQADTIVPNPGDPQSLNRYSYANNNSLRFIDPSGHFPATPLPFPDQWLVQLGQWLEQALQSLTVQAAPIAVPLTQYGPQLTQFAQGISAASQAGSEAGGIGDPNRWNPNEGTERENRVREMLRGHYRQSFGESDGEIRKNLGIQGKTADFVGFNDGQGRWLIAESKASDIDGAVKQLENTMGGLLNKTGYQSIDIDLRIYTNASNYQRLFSGPNGIGGYKVWNGFLGYTNEAGDWVWQLINGVRVSVQVAS